MFDNSMGGSVHGVTLDSQLNAKLNFAHERFPVRHYSFILVQFKYFIHVQLF